MSFFETYGFTDTFASQIENIDPSLQPARVTNVQRNQCRLATSEGDKNGMVSGRFSFTAIDPTDYPVVGDWVLTREGSDAARVIERVLDRETQLNRKSAGSKSLMQVIAANVNTVFLVQSCNADLNLRRLERYLAACTDESMQVVIVFNKADLLAEDSLPPTLPEEWDFPHHIVSAETGQGVDELFSYMQPGTTCVLIGSSGVGKSTLTNRLCEQAEQEIREIRDGDHKGKHTTTSRELFFCKAGGMIVDTPGMREFGLADADVVESGAFDDIAALEGKCKFRKCSHTNEEGCAILLAVANGEIEASRLSSMRKLQREEAYHAKKSDSFASNASKKRWKQITKNYRASHKKQVE